ncbi:MAG: TPM domain-containing protein, partial [Ottowia sp.]|nr:TPM domain-containing protein [Ottowia sp.]
MLGWLGLVQPAGAQPLQPVPELTARVIDTTGTLDAAQKAAIEAKLAALEQEKGSQLVVLMVNTTAPEDIAAYANRLGDAWKIGRRDVGDGVLIVVAKDDRRIRIAPAKALEGAIPDLAARQ